MNDTKQTEREAYHAGYQAGYENGKRDAVRHGEWISYEIDIDTDIWKTWVCSKCGKARTNGWEHTHAGSKPTALFCEHCGARMDGKESGE